jgi:hypothetical protein
VKPGQVRYARAPYRSLATRVGHKRESALTLNVAPSLL